MRKRDFFKVIYIRSRLLNRMSESGRAKTKVLILNLQLDSKLFYFSSCEKREVGRSWAVRLKLMKQAVRGVVQATTIECQKSTRKKQKARAASTQARNYCSGLSLLFFRLKSTVNRVFSSSQEDDQPVSHCQGFFVSILFAIIDFFGGRKIDAKITKLTLVLHIPSGRMPVDGKIEGACKSCPKVPTSNH